LTSRWTLDPRTTHPSKHTRERPSLRDGVVTHPSDAHPRDPSQPNLDPELIALPIKEQIHKKADGATTQATQHRGATQNDSAKEGPIPKLSLR